MSKETKRLRRIGIIGDVHAECDLLAGALDFLRDHSGPLDALFCTGDIVNADGDVDRCCDLLREASVEAVRGNHDRWYFQLLPHRTPAFAGPLVSPINQAFLSALPMVRAYQTTSGPLLLCHGLGNDDMAGVYPYEEGYALEANHHLHALVGEHKYRFVLNGHTHHRMVRTFDDLTIINAGTLRRDHQPVFAIADFDAQFVQFYDISGDDLSITEGERLALTAEKL